MTKWLFCRQNPYKCADQDVMFKLNESGILTAPFGHTKEYVDNYISGTFSGQHPTWGSTDQDRLFNQLSIGDRVCILYTKRGKNAAKMLVVEIMSRPMYHMGETDIPTTCYDLSNKSTTQENFPFIGIKQTRKGDKYFTGHDGDLQFNAVYVRTKVIGSGTKPSAWPNGYSSDGGPNFAGTLGTLTMGQSQQAMTSIDYWYPIPLVYPVKKIKAKLKSRS